MARLTIRAGRELFSPYISIAVFDREGRSVATGFETREYRDDELVPNVCTLHPDQAQTLMDDLWTCGVRPTEGSGSAGSLAATERHLRDMQTISMGLLRQSGVQL